MYRVPWNLSYSIGGFVVLNHDSFIGPLGFFLLYRLPRFLQHIVEVYWPFNPDVLREFWMEDRTYHHEIHLHHIVCILNLDGFLVESLDIDPWGFPYALSNSAYDVDGLRLPPGHGEIRLKLPAELAPRANGTRFKVFEPRHIPFLQSYDEYLAFHGSFGSLKI